MVAIGVAPMTWRGFFVNWLIASVIFDAWFVYKRVQSNWRMFQAIQEKGRPLTREEYMDL